MTFKEYLHKRRLSPGSINTYNRQLKIFSTWLNSQSLPGQETTYTDLLAFIGYCKEKGLKPSYITKILGVVRHYFNYFKYTGQLKNNPAAGLYLKGRQRTIPHDLLSEEQLNEIYNSFQEKGLAAKRNKAMLGLMIYQGLGTGELELLEPFSLLLREGKIQVPGAKKTNPRTLKLKAHQMIDLQQYESKTRGLILETTEKQSNKLFVSLGSSQRLHASIDKLIRKLRKKHEFFVNARQIRQSRLAIWIKQYDIRVVQYMAGHKYVSSTEKYQSSNLEDLKKELEKHHPGSG